MANFLPPFKGSFNSPQFVRWLEELYRKITAAAAMAWIQVDKTGSNLTDLTTRNHADLQSINTASYTHLSSADHTDLTDGGDSELHFHGIVEYETGTGTPTGKKFKIVKYEDGTFDWEEV